MYSLPSRSGLQTFACLVRKEWRELIVSRSWWVMLLLIGPLVGVSFISAVRTYGELSGVNGTAAGVGEAFSPLIGIWAPTFSACELAAVFLLPFVVIRLVGGDRQSGALALELQQPFPAFARVLAKATVLMAGWLIASAAPMLGVLLWRIYGGSIHLPELLTVLSGHVLNAALAVAIAAAAATITEHPSTAAIVTLTITVGGWIINFAAAVNGGIWERLALYTPTAMVGEFQHGLVRLEIVFVALALTCAGLGVAAIWTRLGERSSRRSMESAALLAATALVMVACTFVRPSWDTSEARLNSFPIPDERRLETLDAPLRMEAHLAPEDPRRSDLERNAVAKLRRTLKDFDISYVSETSTGLFEQTREHYGEIRYRLGQRTAVSRATTVEGVLNEIYALAEIAPAHGDYEEDLFRGRPLAATPRGAAAVFYVGWPALVAGMALMARGRGA
jgi:ABC-2 type transport system permease protein